MNMRDFMDISNGLQADREIRKLAIRRREVDQKIRDEERWLDSYTDLDPRHQEVLDSLDELGQERASIALLIGDLRQRKAHEPDGR